MSPSAEASQYLPPSLPFPPAPDVLPWARHSSSTSVRVMHMTLPYAIRGTVCVVLVCSVCPGFPTPLNFSTLHGFILSSKDGRVGCMWFSSSQAILQRPAHLEPPGLVTEMYLPLRERESGGTRGVLGGKLPSECLTELMADPHGHSRLPPHFCPPRAGGSCCRQAVQGSEQPQTPGALHQVRGWGWAEIQCEKLAHALRGTERSHDLPCTSWRPRKASGVLPSKSKGISTGAVGAGKPGRRPGRGPSSVSDTGRRHILSSSTFCSTQTLQGPEGAHPHGGGQPPDSGFQTRISSRNTLTDTHPETELPPGIPQPVRPPQKTSHPRFLPPDPRKQGLFPKDSNRVSLRQKMGCDYKFRSTLPRSHGLPGAQSRDGCAGLAGGAA